MILDHLRTHTRSSHQALEKLLIPRIKNISGKDEYASLLAVFYGYFSPLEQQLTSYINTDRIPDLNERRKASILLEDYLLISDNQNKISLCEDLPIITNEAEAIAVLYVLEGSTLGGKVITQLITKNLGIEPWDGIRFFYGYGDQTGVMWQKFIAILDNYPIDEAIGLAMAKTADDTFIKFKNWIDLN